MKIRTISILEIYRLLNTNIQYKLVVEIIENTKFKKNV